MSRLVASITLAMISTPLLANDLTIPNSFSSGTPARAAEVNENFSAVEASVDDNAASIQANSAVIEMNSASISSNTSAVQANQATIARLDTVVGDLEAIVIDHRPRLVDSLGVEVGRVIQVDGSNIFTIEVLLDGRSGIFRWHPDRSEILTIQGQLQNANVFFDAPCSSSATAITENPYVAAAGLLPIVTGKVYAVDTSTTVTFTIDYQLTANSNGVGCGSTNGTSTQSGFALVDLGTPWFPPFTVK